MTNLTGALAQTGTGPIVRLCIALVLAASLVGYILFALGKLQDQHDFFAHHRKIPMSVTAVFLETAPPGMLDFLPEGCEGENFDPNQSAVALAEAIRPEVVELRRAKCFHQDYAIRWQSGCDYYHRPSLFTAVAIVDKTGRLDRPIRLTGGENMPKGAEFPKPTTLQIAAPYKKGCKAPRYYQLTCASHTGECRATFIGTKVADRHWDDGGIDAFLADGDASSIAAAPGVVARWRRMAAIGSPSWLPRETR